MTKQEKEQNSRELIIENELVDIERMVGIVAEMWTEKEDEKMEEYIELIECSLYGLKSEVLNNIRLNKENI